MKSVQMARCAWRVKRHTLMPSKVLRTPAGLFMSRGDYAKLRSELAANAPAFSGAAQLSAGAMPAIGGLPVYVSELCEPWLRFDGYPLRNHALRYLRRYGQRRGA